ncbi:hypothetical protein [Cupriavidus oxalaticus]|uniref:hypothetical protein n=1 Tax=Cupriavidus oxalaticus TaxID=96344 RepID=UPI00142E9322|nr:hypothetical protein [Cupriavidus oxalaticus]
MVVAMVTVKMVKMPPHEIVDMVAVWNGFVPAARTMYVIGIMAATLMIRGAPVRIGRGHRDDMLINVIAMHVMKMAIVQIVDVAIMQDRQVATVRAVLMRVVGRVRKRAACHGNELHLILPAVSGCLGEHAQGTL